MSKEQKPLTAEEIITRHLSGYWNDLQQKVMLPRVLEAVEEILFDERRQEEDPAIDWDEFCELIGLPADSQRYNLSRNDFIGVLKRYADHQTAALREELGQYKTALSAPPESLTDKS